MRSSQNIQGNEVKLSNKNFFTPLPPRASVKQQMEAYLCFVQPNDAGDAGDGHPTAEECPRSESMGCSCRTWHHFSAEKPPPDYVKNQVNALLDVFGPTVKALLLKESLVKVQYDYATLLETYLDAYLNQPNHFDTGDTPLHVACAYGSIDAVRELVASPQVQLTALNKKGKTAVDVVGDELHKLDKDPRTKAPWKAWSTPWSCVCWFGWRCVLCWAWLCPWMFWSWPIDDEEGNVAKESLREEIREILKRHDRTPVKSKFVSQNGPEQEMAVEVVGDELHTLDDEQEGKVAKKSRCQEIREILKRDNRTPIKSKIVSQNGPAADFIKRALVFTDGNGPKVPMATTRQQTRFDPEQHAQSLRGRRRHIFQETARLRNQLNAAAEAAECAAAEVNDLQLELRATKHALVSAGIDYRPFALEATRRCEQIRADVSK